MANSALARLKFVENSMQSIPAQDGKIAEGVKEARALLDEYRQALTKLIENSKSIDELVGEMNESADAIVKGAGALKSGPAFRPAAARKRVGCDDRGDRAG